MSGKSWLPLISIVICVFLFNMSEFIPVGLLTGISTDLGVSESQTGLIISAYAWAVAILSLPLMLVLRRMEYKRMMLIFVTVFAAFQFMSGISSSYGMLMVSRLGVAVAHSVFWSIASAMAVSVVDFEYRRVALSAVATGTGVAMIVGLPLGRAIGLAVGWRMTFITIAVIAVIVLILLAAVFPRRDNPGTFTVRRLPEIFHNKVIMGTYVALILAVTGYYTGYSYIEPFLGRVAGMSENLITVALIVFGIAGIVGSVVFTKVYPKTKTWFVTATFAVSALALFLMLPSAPWMAAIFGVIAVWGMCQTLFSVAFQNELIAASPEDAVPIVMSLFSGLFNVGIAMGSIIGGVVTDTMSVDNIGNVGGMFLIAAALFFAIYVKRRMFEKETKTD